MSTDLAQLEEAFQLVREDPSSALSLTLLKERVRPYADSVNRDVSELADAMKNLLTQVNSGVVSVSERFLPLLDDIEVYFKRNHDLQISLDKANDLLGKIDYEASGGNLIDPSLDLSKIDSDKKPPPPVARPSPKQGNEIAYEVKAIRVDESDEPSSELEKIDHLRNVERKIAKNIQILNTTISELENRGLQHSHKDLQTHLANSSDRLDVATVELGGVVNSLAALIEGQSRIAHQKIEKQLHKLFKGTNCAISCGPVQMYQSLWSELKALLDRHFRNNPSTQLKSLSFQPVSDETEISITFRADTEIEPESLSTLRADFGTLGAKFEFSEENPNDSTCTVFVPANNRIVSVLLASFSSDWMAIPTHSLIRVEPITKNIQVTNYGEIVHNEEHYLILNELRTSDEPQYFALVDCEEGRFAIPATMVKPDQKLLLREPALKHSQPFGGNIVAGNLVCRYLDLNRLRVPVKLQPAKSLKPYVLVILASEQHVEFATQICAQFGVQVTHTNTIGLALAEFQEMRPLAVILFKYPSYDESATREEDLAEYTQAKDTPLAIFTSGNIDLHYANVLTEDTLLHDFLCDVCSSDDNEEDDVPLTNNDQEAG